MSTAVEFAGLVYGSLVSTLLEMAENVEEVNQKLEEIGYRIGLRFAHDFARDPVLEQMTTPEDLIENVFVKNWPSIGGPKSQLHYKATGPKDYLFTFDQSVFTQNVHILELYHDVKYTAMLPGVLRGIFEVFHYETKVELVNSDAKGTEVKVELVKEIPPAVPKDDD